MVESFNDPGGSCHWIGCPLNGSHGFGIGKGAPTYCSYHRGNMRAQDAHAVTTLIRNHRALVNLDMLLATLHNHEIANPGLFLTDRQIDAISSNPPHPDEEAIEYRRRICTETQNALGIGQALCR